MKKQLFFLFGSAVLTIGFFSLTAFGGKTKAEQEAEIAAKVTERVDAFRTECQKGCDDRIAAESKAKFDTWAAATPEPAPAPAPGKAPKKGTKGKGGPKVDPLPQPAPPPPSNIGSGKQERGDAVKQDAKSKQERGDAVPADAKSKMKRGDAVPAAPAKKEGGN